MGTFQKHSKFKVWKIIVNKKSIKLFALSEIILICTVELKLQKLLY